MATVDFSEHKWMLLIVDVQQGGINGLAEPHATQFPRNVRHFADHLWNRHGVAAAVIAQHPSPDVDILSRKAALDMCGLDVLNVRPHEKLFIKQQDNAFRNGKLERALRADEITGVIIAGMNTSACVTASVLGALRANFMCVVAHDLLADTTEPNNGSPDWHLHTLKREIEAVPPFGRSEAEKRTDNLHMVPSSQILMQLPISPRHPQSPTRTGTYDCA